jgi:hypothetical protein
MLDEGAQQHLVVANGVGDQLGVHDQIVKLNGREVSQGMGLGITPDQLDRIELGSIRGQQVGTHVLAMISKPTGDGLEMMGAQTVPYQSERHAQGTTQLLEEGQNRIAIVIGLGLEADNSPVPDGVAAR